MYFRDSADVDAARRLIEDDQLGPLDQRFGDNHLLLIAAGELDDAGIAAQRSDIEFLVQSAASARVSLMLATIPCDSRLEIWPI